MTIEPLTLFLRSRALALKRRIAIGLRGDFNPYPQAPEGVCLSPSLHVGARAGRASLNLDWALTGEGCVEAWRSEARARLRDLLRVPDETGPVSAVCERVMPVAAGYERRRVYLRFGPGCDAPVDIVARAGTPADRPNPAPVVICMQGTNSGAHLNLGEVRMPADVYKVARGSALALQAADNGYVAVSFERACFGERRERHLEKRSAGPTVDAAFHSLVLGETALGQTVAELEALRRWIGDELAPGAPVYLAGYSAAGTAAIAAAAASGDFAGIAVGGCVGMMRDTLLRRGAGGYNEVPDILKWFEFDALLALIAPRPCLVIAGVSDHIWPHSAAETVMAAAGRAWEYQGASGSLRLVKAPGGHSYYPELMWPELARLVAASQTDNKKLKPPA